MQFGAWLEAERKAHGWSYQTLADRMVATGLTKKASPSWLKQVETGDIAAARMGNDKLLALAAVFGLTVDGLLAAAAEGVLDGTGDGVADDARVLLDQSGITEPEKAEYLALLEQLPQDKRAEAVRHLRWLLTEHHTEQVRQQQAAQRAARGRPALRHSDFQEETQQRAGAC